MLKVIYFPYTPSITFVISFNCSLSFFLHNFPFYLNYFFFFMEFQFFDLSFLLFHSFPVLFPFIRVFLFVDPVSPTSAKSSRIKRINCRVPCCSFSRPKADTTAHYRIARKESDIERKLLGRYSIFYSKGD